MNADAAPGTCRRDEAMPPTASSTLYTCKALQGVANRPTTLPSAARCHCAVEPWTASLDRSNRRVKRAATRTAASARPTRRHWSAAPALRGTPACALFPAPRAVVVLFMRGAKLQRGPPRRMGMGLFCWMAMAMGHRGGALPSLIMSYRNF